MTKESAFQTAVRRFKFHNKATSVETCTATDGGTIYRAYFSHGGYRQITAEALYGAAPTPDEIQQDVFTHDIATRILSGSTPAAPVPLAKFIAELINGGKWEDPQYYTDEQRALWVGHAQEIAAQVFALQPMDTAPKDRPILVLHDHEADTYVDPNDGNRLSLYAAHYEGLSHVGGKCFCVAVWGGGFDESTYEYPGASLPDWWFQDGSEHEVAVNPVGWVDINLEIKP